MSSGVEMPPAGEWIWPAAKVAVLLLGRFKQAVQAVVLIANEQPASWIATDAMVRENLSKIAALNNELTIHNFHSHLKRPEYAKFFASAQIEVPGTAGKHLRGSVGALDTAKHAYDALVAVC